MATISTITPRNGYLHVYFEGQAARIGTGIERALAGHRDKVVAACREHQCRKVLLDLTALRGKITVLEEHLAARIIVKEWPPGTQVAMVSSPEYLANEGKHLERVAQNRGAALRLFNCFDDAEAWLASPEINRDVLG